MNNYSWWLCLYIYLYIQVRKFISLRSQNGWDKRIANDWKLIVDLFHSLKSYSSAQNQQGDWYQRWRAEAVVECLSWAILSFHSFGKLSFMNFFAPWRCVVSLIIYLYIYINGIGNFKRGSLDACKKYGMVSIHIIFDSWNISFISLPYCCIVLNFKVFS